MNRYFEETILNADPVTLTCMVYRHALENISTAREHLRRGRIRERSECIMRAYAALVELVNSLNGEAAPGIALSLGRLYNYMMQRLVTANVEQAEEPLEEVQRILATLSEAWAEIGSADCRAQPVLEGSRVAMCA